MTFDQLYRENPRCAICGALFKLHNMNLHCPRGGIEAPPTLKQEWQDTIFIPISVKIIDSVL